MAEITTLTQFFALLIATTVPVLSFYLVLSCSGYLAHRKAQRQRAILRALFVR